MSVLVLCQPAGGEGGLTLLSGEQEDLMKICTDDSGEQALDENLH